MTAVIDPKIDMRSARLSLRKPRLLDAADIARNANDEAVVRWLERVPFPYQRPHAEDFIRHVDMQWPTGKACHFAIHRLEDKALLGMIGLDADALVKGAWALGYWLGKDHWGQGYAAEAVALLLRQIAPRPAFSIVRALTHPDNVNSGRVLEKAAFSRLSDERRCFFPHIRDWAFCPVWQKVL